MPGPPIGTPPANASSLIFHLFVLPENLKEIMAGWSLSSLPFVWKTINRVGPERISKLDWSNGSQHGAAGTWAAAFGNSNFHKSRGWQMASGYRFVFKNLLLALCVGFHMDLIELKK